MRKGAVIAAYIGKIWGVGVGQLSSRKFAIYCGGCELRAEAAPAARETSLGIVRNSGRPQLNCIQSFEN
jgi:hypothetical protein